VVQTLKAEVKGSDLILALVPERVNQNLSLEQWSLESCAALVRDVTGLRLKIRVQD